MKAVVAVAATLLTAVYAMLRNGVDYRDLGADHFAKHDAARTAKRLTQRLRDLGYTVTLAKAA